MPELVGGVLLFTSLVMLLVAIVLLARRLLVPRGEVRVVVNGQRTLVAARGRRLHQVLAEGGVQLPTACGGVGTCGLCGVVLTAGGGPALPLEVDRFSRAELRSGWRLACQVALREDVDVQVTAASLEARALEMVVRSVQQVGTFLKELVLELPPGALFAFQAGSFVQVTAPPFSLPYAELDVPARYREDWERLGLGPLVARSNVPVSRAYSLANPPAEQGVLLLLVRLATPPPGAGPDIPPGIVSSYLFGLRPGARLMVSGPYGHFLAEDSAREMVFVGGGAGMAPMRSHILDQLEGKRTARTISFWYGARSLKELFYVETFDRLQREHANFTWQVALSEPQADDAWEGATGFIHTLLERAFLATHPAPEACVYYLCGPPLMIRAVTQVLSDHGVEPQDVHADDFGG